MDYELIEHGRCIVAYRTIETGEQGEISHSYKVEHDAAYELLAEVLQDSFGVKLSELEIVRGEHGKPYFKDSDICFNVSHCRGLVVCAVARDAEVGVDAENIRPYRANVTERIFNETELAALDKVVDKDAFFFKVWTFKESVVKLGGEGLSWDAKELNYFNNDFALVQYEIRLGGTGYIISVAMNI